MTTQQTDALQCAADLEYSIARHGMQDAFTLNAYRAMKMVRTQHARIADLEAQLEAIGAGGVSGPPIGQPQAMPDLSQLTERGSKAWAGVDAQGLREGGADMSKERDDLTAFYAWLHTYESEVGALDDGSARVGFIAGRASLQPPGFTAADMATVSAQGFRDGVASLSANAGEPRNAIDRDALIDAIAQGLHGTWHCTRAWEAWHVGTMSQDDFEPVDESETPTEIADAVLALLAAPPAAQAEGWVSAADLPEALRRSTAADGKTELFNLPGYPLMVRAVDFNRIHAESEMRRAALLDEMQKAALAAGQATAAPVQPAAQQGVAYAALPEPLSKRPTEANTLVWVADPISSTGVRGVFVDDITCLWWWGAGLIFQKEADAAALALRMRSAIASHGPAPAGATPECLTCSDHGAVGNSGFDHKTAADFLSGKTVSDEALRKFVAASRGAHDARAALHAKMLSLQGELASREAEITLLKRSLLDAEAAPQPSHTAQTDSVLEDAALWRWLAEYLVGTRTDLDDEIVASETVNDLRKLVEAARKQGEKQ